MLSGRGKTTGTSSGSGERPAKDDGRKDSTGTGKDPGQRQRWQERGAHQRHLPLRPQEDSVKMERNMR